MPDHETLRSLLQDRKSSTKGRASRRMAICLSAELSADLRDAEEDLAAAKQALAEAAKTETARAGGRVPTDPALQKKADDAEKAVAAAEKAADAASVVITFTALKAHEYDDLLKEHPPRADNDLDRLSDYNRDTFPDALMAKSASAKVEDNDGNLVDIDIADLIDGMSNGERIVACQVAGGVNDQTSSFSEAKSQHRPRSGSSSKRR
jgi:hypothetical protein